MLTWRFWVDWDGDGVYEADEGPRMFGMQLHRGRNAAIRRDGRGFEPPQVGEGTVLLIDDSGRYDPWNTGSPLYPNFTANKRFRLEVSDGVTAWPVVAGRVKSIKREEREGVPAVRLDIEDGWALLGEPVYIPMQRGVYAGIAMGLVLDAAGWPTDKRDLSAGVDQHEVWWVDGVPARQALHELAEAEYGTLALRADGTLWFRDRHEMYTAVSTVTAADIQRGYRIPLPWDTVRTVARVRAYLPRDVSGVLTTRHMLMPIQGNATDEIFIDVRDVYVETIASVDITATENEDGTGADLSSQVTVTTTLLSPQRVKLVVTNTGAQVVYLQTVTLNGTGVAMDGYVDREAENATGKGLYGERLLVIDNFWLQDPLVAKDLADHYATWYGDPAPERALLELTLKGVPSLQFGVDIGDVVRVQVGGIDADYRLLYTEHRWLDRQGQITETKWLLRPAFAFSDMYWFFPTKLGETSRFGF